MVAGRLGRRIWRRLRPATVAAAARRLARRARSILSGPAFLRAFAPALAELVADAGCLYRMFLAAGYRAKLGAILVAYGAANIVSAVRSCRPGWG
jgi:uncharacterized membrane protein YbhN (UPF0104 family)